MRREEEVSTFSGLLKVLIHESVTKPKQIHFKRRERKKVGMECFGGEEKNRNTQPCVCVCVGGREKSERIRIREAERAIAINQIRKSNSISVRA